MLIKSNEGKGATFPEELNSSTGGRKATSETSEFKRRARSLVKKLGCEGAGRLLNDRRHGFNCKPACPEFPNSEIKLPGEHSLRGFAFRAQGDEAARLPGTHLLLTVCRIRLRPCCSSS